MNLPPNSGIPGSRPSLDSLSPPNAKQQAKAAPAKCPGVVPGALGTTTTTPNGRHRDDHLPEHIFNPPRIPPSIQRIQGHDFFNVPHFPFQPALAEQIELGVIPPQRGIYYRTTTAQGGKMDHEMEQQQQQHPAHPQKHSMATNWSPDTPSPSPPHGAEVLDLASPSSASSADALDLSGDANENPIDNWGGGSWENKPNKKLPPPQPTDEELRQARALAAMSQRLGKPPPIIATPSGMLIPPEARPRLVFDLHPITPNMSMLNLQAAQKYPIPKTTAKPTGSQAAAAPSGTTPKPASAVSSSCSPSEKMLAGSNLEPQASSGQSAVPAASQQLHFPNAAASNSTLPSHEVTTTTEGVQPTTSKSPAKDNNKLESPAAPQSPEAANSSPQAFEPSRTALALAAAVRMAMSLPSTSASSAPSAADQPATFSQTLPAQSFSNAATKAQFANIKHNYLFNHEGHFTKRERHHADFIENTYATAVDESGQPLRKWSEIHEDGPPKAVFYLHKPEAGASSGKRDKLDRKHLVAINCGLCQKSCNSEEKLLEHLKVDHVDYQPPLASKVTTNQQAGVLNRDIIVCPAMVSSAPTAAEVVAAQPAASGDPIGQQAPRPSTSQTAGPPAREPANEPNLVAAGGSSDRERREPIRPRAQPAANGRAQPERSLDVVLQNANSGRSNENAASDVVEPNRGHHPVGPPGPVQRVEVGDGSSGIIAGNNQDNIVSSTSESLESQQEAQNDIEMGALADQVMAEPADPPVQDQAAPQAPAAEQPQPTEPPVDPDDAPHIPSQPFFCQICDPKIYFRTDNEFFEHMRTAVHFYPRADGTLEVHQIKRAVVDESYKVLLNGEFENRNTDPKNYMQMCTNCSRYFRTLNEMIFHQLKTGHICYSKPLYEDEETKKARAAKRAARSALAEAGGNASTVEQQAQASQEPRPSTSGVQQPQPQQPSVEESSPPSPPPARRSKKQKTVRKAKEKVTAASKRTNKRSKSKARGRKPSRRDQPSTSSAAAAAAASSRPSKLPLRRSAPDDEEPANEDGKYFCEYCPKTFTFFRGLNMHLNRWPGEHTTCEICNKLVFGHDLARHMRGHGKLAKYPRKG